MLALESSVFKIQHFEYDVQNPDFTPRQMRSVVKAQGLFAYSQIRTRKL
jgi:hypothetical protein